MHVYSELSFCREQIDSFMMMAGFVLFFAARDHISYYSSKFFEKVHSFFKRPNTSVKRFYFPISKSDKEASQQNETLKALKRVLNSRLIEKETVQSRLSDVMKNKSVFSKCLWKGIQFGITAGNCLIFAMFMIYSRVDRESFSTTLGSNAGVSGFAPTSTVSTSSINSYY